MTRADHLLLILAEECAEVAQRVSKALRFGLAEIQPGQPLTNSQRIIEEVSDLKAVLEMLIDENIMDRYWNERQVAAKKAKVEKFLKYSRECGRLE